MKIRKLAGDAALGLLVTAVLMGVLELTLSVLDLGASEASMSLSRGFDPSERYIVPDPEVPGGFRTRVFATPQSEKRIAPKSKRTRVLLFGGSNTAAFPAPHLARQLNGIAPDGRFEVVNLGRAGYGSERVSLLFGQALELLEPDIVVLYAGHNEFMEGAFAMDLPSGWVQESAALLGRTRAFNVLTDLFAPRETVRRSKTKDWKREYKKFEGITYDHTRKYFEAYGQNLRKMCRAAGEKGVRVVLCTPIHNRLAPPFMSTLPRKMNRPDRERFDELYRAAADRIPRFLEPLLPEYESQRLHKREWGKKSRDAPGTHPPLPGLRPSFAELEGRDPGWPGREGWDPKVERFYGALERFFARDYDEREGRWLAETQELLDQALELCPDHPRAHFDKALVTWILGGDEEAVAEHLDLAARYDRAPRKANGATNDIVREVAAELPEVLLLDTDALFAARVPGGLVGWEWMTDHCHLSRGAAVVLMEDIARAISERWYGPR